MKRQMLLAVLCIVLMCSCEARQTQQVKVKTGIEVLREQHFDCLQGKRVGLCTNPTGDRKSVV